MEKLKELCSLIGHIRQGLADWRLYQRYPDHPRLRELNVLRVPILTDFLWMLQRFHAFDCTKANDRLHAIASLWKSTQAAEVFNISSDYTLSCEQLYTQFAHRFITAHLPRTQAISQLLSIAADQAGSGTRENREPVPSWVVDWRLQPALNISLDEVFGDVNLRHSEPSDASEIILATRCYGTVVEAHGHYRDWTLLTERGLVMPCSEGNLSDDEYVTSLSQLCTRLDPGDILCQPYAQYRGRLGHVADAGIVLRPCKTQPHTVRIAGRFPLDLWFNGATGINRDTASIPSTAITVCIV
ncbi:hypothetical protein CLAFUW4_03479 [Fulvia fulva]|uniref:Uncharacterized protein n=1 Tax=Passalora fulva TaxID=5499 RepID=A0A9Q8P5R6_PASFU|nr:uncharacterized protein CLAFUR5_03458 [Fulvia fulva]KAK4631414.1 hypothetical protein CLAFUR4_03468 [Fulvia fulva]KAK4632949.1 hypothetical protein CLAFUR0_03473 [Fulvia fulva]UJO14027.1 hypothetical protein CLAFUR5_03458 [Fulvia fulva]WPV10766.1 hypothetical protein CLAFUW4_03479 [Fulvia fulva]WPV25896.1 hypothetical protein CLAFUW7_03471 [Fulvia fulva]